MRTYDLYPTSAPADSVDPSVYIDTAAAARGAVARSTIADEMEFARAVRWARRKGATDDMAREVLRGVPPERDWRQGFGDWVVTDRHDEPRVVVGRVPVMGSLLVADEFGEMEQVDELDVAWMFRVPTITPSYALVGRGAEFDNPRPDDDVAWQWCWVDSLGPSLAVKMIDESTVAVFSGRLVEVRADRVRVALGGVPAWDTVTESGVFVPKRVLTPDQRYVVQKLVDDAGDVKFGTDKHCAVEYLLRVAYGDAR